jgi:ferric-dicitrate binding protein FerR (iron transport regulator)
MVPYGKSSVLILHDGTKIWVNAGTRLVYPVEFEKGKREIYVNGEIFLDVAHDAQRPFIVRTNNLRIQVIGTRFNVQVYAVDDHSRIALESGLVKIISETADDVLLIPNKMYEQDKSGHSSVKDVDIRKYTSWIYGLYIYESERLDMILKRLTRYYGTEIVFDASVSEIRCSGKLDLKENLDDVLSSISMAALVEYVKDGESYIISVQP